MTVCVHVYVHVDTCTCMQSVGREIHEMQEDSIIVWARVVYLW